MKLVEVALENFRGYATRTVLPLSDLTTLVGKNDAGKSTFLEALNIVLGDGKIDASDVNVRAPVDATLCIECTFEDLPSELTLDAGSTTTLSDEFLVDESGRLRIRWVYATSGVAAERKVGKAQVMVVAHHPTGNGVANLHSLKNTELKKVVKAAEIETECNLANNASMRHAIWANARQAGRLELSTTTLDLSKDDGKSILDQILRALPLYVLFRADRASTDQDAEVQDPMKVAVRTALEELRTEVEVMKARVKEKALEVANRTLGSLREFDPALADSLSPEFADPKLDSVFKLALLGDDGIAVNKRGSGVRRLVLFSFFRAEAERRQGTTSSNDIVYAIEEPETAQHPDFQRKVVSTLQRLSQSHGCQVIITTHSPGLAGLLPCDSIRLVGTNGADRTIETGDAALNAAVSTLGVVPDHRVRVLICVEGPYDRSFLQASCAAYKAAGEDYVCLKSDPSVAFILLGGSTLMEWTTHNLLHNTRIPEFHIYDGDIAKYADAVQTVRNRQGRHTARQTSKRELENYLHPAAIQRTLATPAGNLGAVSFGPQDDVESVVAAAMPDPNGQPRKKLERRALKNWLNNDVANAMSAAEFDQQDPGGELRSWFADISRLARDG